MNTVRCMNCTNTIGVGQPAKIRITNLGVGEPPFSPVETEYLFLSCYEQDATAQRLTGWHDRSNGKRSWIEQKNSNMVHSGPPNIIRTQVR